MRPRSALLLAAALAVLPRLAAAQPNPCAPKPGLRSHMLRVVAKEEPKPPPAATASARPKPPTRPVAQAPKPPERCNLTKALFGGADASAARTALPLEPGHPTLPVSIRQARTSRFRPSTVFVPSPPAGEASA